MTKPALRSDGSPSLTSNVAIKRLRKDIVGLRREVELIRHMLEEDYDVEEKTRRTPEQERTPESEHVDLDEP